MGHNGGPADPSPGHAPDTASTPPLADQVEDAYRRIPLTRTHAGIVAMVMFGVFFDAVSQNTVGLAGPTLKQQWHLDTADIGALNTVTFTAAACGRIWSGTITDRFGRRALVGLNLILFSIGSLICAFSINYPMLVAARCVVGLGLGGEIAVAVIMLSEFFSAQHRGVAVGLINVAGGGLGNVFAPAFGIVAFATFTGPDGWRWLFGLLAAPALAVPVYRRILPETPRYLAATGQIDRANAVLHRLATGRLTSAVEDAPGYLVAPPRAAGTALPPRWTEAFCHRYRRTTLALSVAACTSYAAQFTMLTLIPVILTGRGLSLTHALTYTLVMQCGSLVGAITATALARRFPRKPTLTAAALLGMTAALCFGLFARDALWALVFGFLFNAAVITLNTTIWLFAPEHYPTRIRGRATSFILATGSLSGALFPLIAGAALDAYGAPTMFALLTALCTVCAVAVRVPRETFGAPMPEAPDPQNPRSTNTAVTPTPPSQNERRSPCRD